MDVEDLILDLLEALLEILGEVVLQLIFELVVEALSELIESLGERGPAFSAMGLAFAGALAGLLSARLFPHRLIAARVVIPGASLLLAPLATGCAMYFLGKGLRHLGRDPSKLATFGGAAIFAFSMALIRWWLVSQSH